jgi:hypothetical protein
MASGDLADKKRKRVWRLLHDMGDDPTRCDTVSAALKAFELRDAKERARHDKDTTAEGLLAWVVVTLEGITAVAKQRMPATSARMVQRCEAELSKARRMLLRHRRSALGGR